MKRRLRRHRYVRRAIRAKWRHLRTVRNLRRAWVAESLAILDEKEVLPGLVNRDYT